LVRRARSDGEITALLILSAWLHNPADRSVQSYVTMDSFAGSGIAVVCGPPTWLKAHLTAAEPLGGSEGP